MEKQPTQISVLFAISRYSRICWLFLSFFRSLALRLLNFISPGYCQRVSKRDKFFTLFGLLTVIRWPVAICIKKTCYWTKIPGIICTDIHTCTEAKVLYKEQNKLTHLLRVGSSRNSLKTPSFMKHFPSWSKSNVSIINRKATNFEAHLKFLVTVKKHTQITKYSPFLVRSSSFPFMLFCRKRTKRANHI